MLHIFPSSFALHQPVPLCSNKNLFPFCLFPAITTQLFCLSEWLMHLDTFEANIGGEDVFIWKRAVKDPFCSGVVR